MRRRSTAAPAGPPAAPPGRRCRRTPDRPPRGGRGARRGSAPRPTGRRGVRPGRRPRPLPPCGRPQQPGVPAREQRRGPEGGGHGIPAACTIAVRCWVGCAGPRSRPPARAVGATVATLTAARPRAGTSRARPPGSREATSSSRADTDVPTGTMATRNGPGGPPGGRAAGRARPHRAAGGRRCPWRARPPGRGRSTARGRRRGSSGGAWVRATPPVASPRGGSPVFSERCRGVGAPGTAERGVPA